MDLINFTEEELDIIWYRWEQTNGLENTCSQNICPKTLSCMVPTKKDGCLICYKLFGKYEPSNFTVKPADGVCIANTKPYEITRSCPCETLSSHIIKERVTEVLVNEGYL